VENGNGIVIWKNGVESQYTKELPSLDIASLSISNGDLYMAGTKNSKGYMFKNGVMTQLSPTASVVSAKSIFVY